MFNNNYSRKAYMEREKLRHTANIDCLLSASIIFTGITVLVSITITPFGGFIICAPIILWGMEYYRHKKVLKKLTKKKN